jgi:hypothetical protein
VLSCLALLAAATLASGEAAANGRFPRAERLLEDPQDAEHLILGATFGLLVTSDAGSSWQHVCEASFAEAGLQTDPLIAFAPDGAVLAGIYASVARSNPDACDFHKTLGMNNREAVPDFALAASVPGRAIGVLVRLLEDGSSQNQLYRSDDSGQSWSTLGPLLPDSIRTVATVDVAPSDAECVYLSGLDAEGAGVLLRSDDGGETFEAFPVPTNSVQGEVPYIAAVDPDDAHALYLRTDEWEYVPTEQVAHANDALLYSSDGGAHFSELLRKRGKLFGFTFSPNGQELLIGYGDPVEAGGGRLTDAAALGIYQAPKGSSDFERRYTGSIGCLNWTARGLYACTLEADTGFSLGRIASTDFALDSTAELRPLLRLADVVGPLACPACSSGAICGDYWESTCQSWGRMDCQSLLDEASAQCGGAGGQGSAGSAAGGESAGGTDQTSFAAGSGCACRIGRAEGPEGAWCCALLGALLLLRPSAKALRAAGVLRFGDSPFCRKRTAPAPGALRRRGRA